MLAVRAGRLPVRVGGDWRAGGQDSVQALHVSEIVDAFRSFLTGAAISASAGAVVALSAMAWSWVKNDHE